MTRVRAVLRVGGRWLLWLGAMVVGGAIGKTLYDVSANVVANLIANYLQGLTPTASTIRAVLVIFWLVVCLLSLGLLVFVSWRPIPPSWFARCPAWVRARGPTVVRFASGAIGLVLFILALFLPPYSPTSAASALFYARRLTLPALELSFAVDSVSLGQQAAYTLHLDGTPVPDRYRCDWSESDSRLGGSFTNSCKPGFVEFADARRYGLSGPGAETVLPVRVRVADEAGRPLGGASAHLTVRYARVVQIQSDNVAFAGSEIPLSVRVSGQPAPPDVRCVWPNASTVRVPDDTKSCEARLTVAAPMVAPSTTGTMDVVVKLVDLSGSEIADSTKTIQVQGPPPNYYLYVVDASRRTGERIDGGTVLDAERASLRDDLRDRKPAGGYAGLQVFGHEGTVSPAARCRNTDRVVDLMPINVDAMTSALGALRSGYDEAPLYEALRAALDTLVPLQSATSRSYLVTLTGGLDTCEKARMADVMTRLMGGLDTPDKRKMVVDFRFLSIMIALETPAAAPSDPEAPRVESVGSPILQLSIKVSNSRDLHTILGYVDDLGSPDVETRIRACASLQEVARNGRDGIGENVMKAYCDRLTKP